MPFGTNSKPPSVALRESTYKPGEKVLEYTYGNGKFTFKITKVKAKLILQNTLLLQDFADACGSGDWTKVMKHFGTDPLGSTPTKNSAVTQTVVHNPPPTPGTRGPATVIKGSFAEVERRVGMGGEVIPPEKPAKKEHVSVIETTEERVTFK